MPKIPDSFLNSVVTLLGTTGRPIGTGFVFHYMEDDLLSSGNYLVTCEHCIADAASARFSAGDQLSLDGLGEMRIRG